MISVLSEPCIENAMYFVFSSDRVLIKEQCLRPEMESICSSKNLLDGGNLGWVVSFEFCVGCVAVSVSCSTLPKLIQALFQNDINLVLRFVLGVKIEPRDSPSTPKTHQEELRGASG